MPDEDYMNTAVAELFQHSQKAGELLGQVDVTLAVAEVFEALLVGLAADLLDEELFGPVDGVDD